MTVKRRLLPGLVPFFGAVVFSRLAIAAPPSSLILLEESVARAAARDRPAIVGGASADLGTYLDAQIKAALSSGLKLGPRGEVVITGADLTAAASASYGDVTKAVAAMRDVLVKRLKVDYTAAFAVNAAANATQIRQTLVTVTPKLPSYEETVQKFEPLIAGKTPPNAQLLAVFDKAVDAVSQLRLQIEIAKMRVGLLDYGAMEVDRSASIAAEINSLAGDASANILDKSNPTMALIDFMQNGNVNAPPVKADFLVRLKQRYADKVSKSESAWTSFSRKCLGL